jgi:hypothetical protein
MRGQDHWRIVGILPAELRGKEGLGFEDVIPSVRREAGSALTFQSCSWFSTYRIHHRAAARFRAGRCFVLGDAAHVHSPVGAQGMNTGLQDAYNLAWKLALVVQGRAAPSLLDSYEAERMHVAQRLLNTTDRGFRLVVSDSWWAGLFRTHILARIAAFAVNRQRVQRLAFSTVSQTGIHYRKSPLSHALDAPPDKAPQAGDRFPWMTLQLEPGGDTEDLFLALDDTRFHLLAFGQPETPKVPLYEGMLTAHAVPVNAHNDAELARAGIARRAFYLLRPDGHVGLCGTRLDAGAIERYFADRLAFGPAAAQDRRIAASGRQAPDAPSTA